MEKEFLGVVGGSLKLPSDLTSFHQEYIHISSPPLPSRRCANTRRAFQNPGGIVIVTIGITFAHVR